MTMDTARRIAQAVIDVLPYQLSDYARELIAQVILDEANRRARVTTVCTDVQIMTDKEKSEMANKALTAANEAAKKDFDEYLDYMNATATQYVPHSVEEAAQAAYVAAGGTARIEVRGHGNTTHPVCSVSVHEVR